MCAAALIATEANNLTKKHIEIHVRIVVVSIREDPKKKKKNS